MPNYIIFLPDIHFKGDTLITMPDKKKRKEQMINDCRVTIYEGFSEEICEEACL